ncbi:hypothetical protein E6C27_scaffold403G001330 [Cucumis melo var. makuwa]|uniref:Uncharacterized protein n=1 Tax=Cucumis melo var. makuwa TaxID=1194695 RepID=A0A5A7SXB3_CUCMM|nr:hypothetical protein E6C27_scaffold403G001330 [Cucumis melo var. makuwa]
MVRIGATKCTGQRPTKGKRRRANDDGQATMGKRRWASDDGQETMARVDLFDEFFHAEMIILDDGEKWPNLKTPHVSVIPLS